MAIRRTGELPHRRHTPVIMLSGEAVETSAYRAGVTVFLRKPDEAVLVAETIARLLARTLKLH